MGKARADFFYHARGVHGSHADVAPRVRPSLLVVAPKPHRPCALRSLDAMLPAIVDLRELPSLLVARHPWEVARAEFFAEIVRRRSDPQQPVAVLDVGAGDGYLAGQLLGVLPHGSQVVCFDPLYTPEHLETLQSRAPQGVTFAREPAREFDWLLLLDVIEHVSDDVALLGELATNRLKRGGHALISVPAWPALFTRHDVMLGHYRRYRRHQLDAVVAQSGLRRVDGGSLFASLLLPRLASKLGERVRGISSVPSPDAVPAHAATDVGAWRGGRAVTAAVSWALSQDSRATRSLSRAGIHFPGLSTWALARRPEPSE